MANPHGRAYSPTYVLRKALRIEWRRESRLETYFVSQMYVRYDFASTGPSYLSAGLNIIKNLSLCNLPIR